MGYVQELNKQGTKAKLEIGLIRSHYIGRTFIQPRQDVRENKVKTKFNPVKGVLKDKVVVIVDDSIVRGTTSKQLVQLVTTSASHLHRSGTPVTMGWTFPRPRS
jgi:amidophosphoribosyltransferase